MTSKLQKANLFFVFQKLKRMENDDCLVFNLALFVSLSNVSGWWSVVNHFKYFLCYRVQNLWASQDISDFIFIFIIDKEYLNLIKFSTSLFATVYIKDFLKVDIKNINVEINVLCLKQKFNFWSKSSTNFNISWVIWFKSFEEIRTFSKT